MQTRAHTSTAIIAVFLSLQSTTAIAESIFGKGFDDVVDSGKKLVPGAIYDAQKDAVNAVTDAAEQAAKDAIKVVAPPVAVSLDLLQGDTPDEAFDELVDDLKSAVSSAATLPAVTTEATAAVATATAGTVAGDAAADAVAIASLPNQIINRIPAATIDATFKISEGEDVSVVLGIPLAAAINQAIAHYQGSALPVPDSVKTLLSQGGFISLDHINSVRYVVDKDGGTIASLVNRLMKELGHTDDDGNHAVTVGNIVVFTKEPSKGIKDIWFWAHEVQHTVQYANLGVEKFAADYTTDSSSLEQDANNVANSILAEIVKITELFLAASQN